MGSVLQIDAQHSAIPICRQWLRSYLAFCRVRISTLMGEKMGYTTQSIRVESVSPQEAERFLACKYVHQRKLSQPWAKFLANEMREGRFVQTAEIHIMYCNGEPHLVNGQHTCAAIIDYGKPVRVTVRKTSTGEPGQLALMYSFGHDNGRKRSFTDGLGAYNMGEQLGLGNYQTERVAAAMKFIRDGYGKPTRYQAAPLTEIVDAMSDWAPYARMFWNNAMAPAGELQRIKTGIDKMSVLSVLLVTYRYKPLEAREFWVALISPGLDDADPRWYARRVVGESVQRANYDIGQAKTPEFVARRLAKCWGAFIGGKRMGQMPRVSDIDPKARIVIDGSPYNGRQPAPPWWPD